MFYSLCRYLPRSGVKVLGLVSGSEQVKDDSSGIVRSFSSDSESLYRRLYQARRAARGILRGEHIDLIACHFALYGAPLLDVLHQTPTVVHFHGPWAAESTAEGESYLKTRFKALVERSVYRTGLRFIVLSRAFRDVLCDRYGVSDRLVRIVPGGVDADRFDVSASPSAARNRLDWPTDRPIILSVRRLARRMGLSNLITAMERVIEHHPDALLLIAGKGPLREELSAMIQAKNLEKSVQLLGFVPEEDLPFAYRAADLSIVPTTEHEGFGLITIESLAAGTPVLVTPVGGLPETVRELSSNLILPDASTETVGEALVSALRGSLSLPDAERCRHYARSRFDWPVIASKVRDVYEDVL
jgi:glycosyltransferase involved in cell wall biosynthesis